MWRYTLLITVVSPLSPTVQPHGGDPQSPHQTNAGTASGSIPLTQRHPPQAGGAREEPQGVHPQKQVPYHSTWAGQRKVCAPNPRTLEVQRNGSAKTTLLYYPSHFNTVENTKCELCDLHLYSLRFSVYFGLQCSSWLSERAKALLAAVFLPPDACDLKIALNNSSQTDLITYWVHLAFADGSRYYPFSTHKDAVTSNLD